MPGGVCAVLDYEVEMMAEYVADMSMRVVMPNASVTGAFRKFVSQVLTSTRLPSTTILLGLNYLAKRVNTLQAAGVWKTNEGQVWRMLTVSLLLGSKFLDDNTFQNRSWSEVSGIAVQELNTMENEWLRHIDWSLYVNLDKSGDYNAWLQNWKDWEANKKRELLAHKQQQAAAARERLAPLVTTNIRTNTQHHPLSYEGWTPEEISDYERGRLARAPGKSYRSRENSWAQAQQYQNGWSAPLTPPDSGYGTPEYMNSAASLSTRYNDWFSSAIPNSGYRGYQTAAPTLHSNYNRNGYQQQTHYNHYGSQSIWDANVAECNCSQCMATLHKPTHYFQHHAYGQPVMG
ncbi:hypothetical protein TruAng_001870 [Truncatella angustata]|nr:hypothetical protein TruAng_001870 [Truncatella angustata]